MSADAGVVIQRWFEEVWNDRRDEAIDELFAPDGIAHGLGEGSPNVRGPAAFRVFLRNMLSAIPDARIRIVDKIVQGDKAVVRLILEGTHAGEGLGVSPTGKRLSIDGIVMVRVAGGQIVEGWNSWDQLGLFRNIGAIPAEDSGDRFLTAHA